MPLGIKPPALPPKPAARILVARGQSYATATVKSNKQHIATTETRAPLAPVAFDEPYATVGTELGTTMNVEFNSVTSKVFISRPCRNTEADIEVAKAANFAFCEQALANQAVWGKEILSTLVEVRRRGEGA